MSASSRYRVGLSKVCHTRKLKNILFILMFAYQQITNTLTKHWQEFSFFFFVGKNWGGSNVVATSPGRGESFRIWKNSQRRLGHWGTQWLCYCWWLNSGIHQFEVGSLSPLFIGFQHHPRWCKISAINSMFCVELLVWVLDGGLRGMVKGSTWNSLKKTGRWLFCWLQPSTVLDGCFVVESHSMQTQLAQTEVAAWPDFLLFQESSGYKPLSRWGLGWSKSNTTEN